MRAIEVRHAVRSTLAALLSVGAAAVGQAASFSAEVVETSPGGERTGTFQIQDGSYRYELAGGGESMIVTKDAATGQMRLLRPSAKQYVEAGPDDPLSRLADLFGCYAYYARIGEISAEGTESIHGVPCTKNVVSMNGQVHVIGWYAEDLQFPLKVELPVYSKTIELRNVRPVPQGPDLAALPEGYQPMERREEVQVPDWAAKVAEAPQPTVPFERVLEAGDILRVAPVAGQHLRIVVVNVGTEPATFTGVGFKGGRPLSNPMNETATFDPEGEISMTYRKQPSEVEAVVLRLAAGRVKVTASHIAAEAAESPLGFAKRSAEHIDAELSCPSAVDIGSRFEVQWGGPGANEDYITVARADQRPGAYVTMARVREGNPLKLWAPSDPGEYEVRYILGRGTKVVLSTTITVNAVETVVEAEGPVRAADWIEIGWQGPGGEGDYITVARPGQPPGASLGLARVKTGNPVRVRAPSDAGEYELRYILARGPRILGTAPITIEPVSAAVEAPASVAASADLEVSWNGPGYNEDMITIARANQPPGASVASRATRQGNPAKLKAPKEPGEYEVRYVLGRGPRLLVTVPITVTAPGGP